MFENLSDKKHKDTRNTMNRFTQCFPTSGLSRGLVTGPLHSARYQSTVLAWSGISLTPNIGIVGVAIYVLGMALPTRVVLSALLLAVFSPCQAQYAVLEVKTTEFDGTILYNSTCAAYNSNFTNLPSAGTELVTIHAKFFLRESSACFSFTVPSVVFLLQFSVVVLSGGCAQAENVSGLAVVSPVDGCTTHWLSLQEAGAAMVVLVSSTSALVGAEGGMEGGAGSELLLRCVI